MNTTHRRTLTQYIALSLLASCTSFARAEAPTGGFLVHLNQQTSFSDSRRSVTFYDADNLASGSASPLFSVHIPGEIRGLGAYNPEEVSAIATDPNTGDVYVLSLDLGTVGNVATETLDAPIDTDGDFDLYKINFQAIYDHWSTNFRGTSVVADITTAGGFSCWRCRASYSNRCSRWWLGRLHHLWGRATVRSRPPF